MMFNSFQAFMIFFIYFLICLCVKVDYIANYMDQDQTAPIVFASMMKSTIMEVHLNISG